MGRGDLKTRKGKTFAGSFGNRRPHKSRGKGKAAIPGKRREELKR